MVESQAKMRKNECVPEIVAVGPNSKSFQGFLIIFHADIGYLVKVLSSHEATLSPKNLENIGNFEAWGLTLISYEKKLILVWI